MKDHVLDSFNRMYYRQGKHVLCRTFGGTVTEIDPGWEFGCTTCGYGRDFIEGLMKTAGELQACALANVHLRFIGSGGYLCPRCYDKYRDASPFWKKNGVKGEEQHAADSK